MATHASTAKLSATERAVVYGGIMTAIRAAMERKGMKPADLNVALKRERGHAGIYHYINGTGAPDATTRPKLARVLGVPESALRKAALPDGAVRPAEPQSRPGPVQAPAIGRLPDVLTFAILADGTARLRLDYTAPAERGVALLRLLLDAGLVLTTAAV